MLLLIDDLDLEYIPVEPVIPGEAPHPDHQYHKYLIKNNDVVGDWFYLLKNSKFSEVQVRNKIIYSLVQLNLDLDFSLWIDSKEKIKKEIYEAGKVCREESVREILQLKYKISQLENKLNVVLQYLNLNI